MRFFTYVIFFIALWYIWSGHTEPFFLICGAVSIMLSLLISARMQLLATRRAHMAFAYKIIPYSLWLMKEIFLSALTVSKKAWEVSPKLTPGFAWIAPLSQKEAGLVAFANSITLTPGTMTVDAQEAAGNKSARLRIHALQAKDLPGLAGSNMDRRVMETFE